MLVNQTATGWEVVYHRAHALLAAQIALEWHSPDRVERIADTIAAIAQHDDLVREWEGGILSPAGAPLDFTLAEKHPADTAPWDELLTTALYRGRWVALLTALHIEFLTAPEREKSKRLDDYLTRLAAQIEAWRSALGVSKDSMRRSYAFVQWCDRLSLILARRELPARERRVEIATGPDDRIYHIAQRADLTVVVEPWPFRSDRFTLEVDAVTLDQLHFKTEAELVKALKEAPVTTVRWEFSRRGDREDDTTPPPASE